MSSLNYVKEIKNWRFAQNGEEKLGHVRPQLPPPPAHSYLWKHKAYRKTEVPKDPDYVPMMSFVWWEKDSRIPVEHIAWNHAKKFTVPIQTVIYSKSKNSWTVIPKQPANEKKVHINHPTMIKYSAKFDDIIHFRSSEDFMNCPEKINEMLEKTRRLRISE